MKGIEAAFFGSLGKDVELRTAKSGKAWASLAVVVDTGEQDADGKDKPQWVKVAVFGETAERLANATRGTRLYTEGRLSLDSWNDKNGEVKHGLSCAAFKCERVGSSSIGRNRPKAAKHFEQDETPGMNGRPSPSFCAGPAQRERPGIVGRDDFNDALPNW